jgi:hypothetical protein
MIKYKKMNNINEVLVREFFEMLGFVVKANLKFIPKGKAIKRGVDFFVVNLNPSKVKESEAFVLDVESIKSVQRAVIRIEPWHTDKFYPSVVIKDEGLLDFLSPENLKEAKKVLKGSDFKKILVISRLPANQEMRNKSEKILKEKGIDYLITFPIILSGLIDNIKSNKNYYNDALELLRILKHYKLFKKPQLELFKK